MWLIALLGLCVCAGGQSVTSHWFYLWLTHSHSLWARAQLPLPTVTRLLHSLAAWLTVLVIGFVVYAYCAHKWCSACRALLLGRGVRLLQSRQVLARSAWPTTSLRAIESIAMQPSSSLPVASRSVDHTVPLHRDNVVRATRQKVPRRIGTARGHEEYPSLCRLACPS